LPATLFSKQKPRGRNIFQVDQKTPETGRSNGLLFLRSGARFNKSAGDDQSEGDRDIWRGWPAPLCLLLVAGPRCPIVYFHNGARCRPPPGPPKGSRGHRHSRPRAGRLFPRFVRAMSGLRVRGIFIKVQHSASMLIPSGGLRAAGPPRAARRWGTLGGGTAAGIFCHIRGSGTGESWGLLGCTRGRTGPGGGTRRFSQRSQDVPGWGGPIASGASPCSTDGPKTVGDDLKGHKKKESSVYRGHRGSPHYWARRRKALGRPAQAWGPGRDSKITNGKKQGARRGKTETKRTNRGATRGTHKAEKRERGDRSSRVQCAG